MLTKIEKTQIIDKLYSHESSRANDLLFHFTYQGMYSLEYSNGEYSIS